MRPSSHEVCFLPFEQTGRICFFPKKLVITVTAIFWNHQFDLWVRTLSYHIRNFHSVILSNKIEAIFFHFHSTSVTCTRFAQGLHLKWKILLLKWQTLNTGHLLPLKKSSLCLWRSIIHSLIHAPTFSPGSFTNSHALPALNFAFQSRH